MREIDAPSCIDCGILLTEVEHHYYGIRCEECEDDWCATITAWKNGKPNEELDRIFGGV